MRPSPLLMLALTVAPSLSACGSTCGQVADEHARFFARASIADPPVGGYLDVPAPLIDRLLAEQITAVPAAPLALPGLEGLTVAPLAARMIPAAPGKVAFDLEFAVRQGRRTLFTLATSAEVTPRFDPSGPALAFEIGPDALTRVAPRLGPGASKAVAAAIRAQLPRALRIGLSGRRLRRLVDAALARLAGDGYQLLRDGVLSQMAARTEVRLDLPKIPLARAQVRSRRGYLQVALHAALPGEATLRPATHPPDPDRLRLRLAGGVVAELANHGIEAGVLPGRFSAKGAPDPEGPLRLGLGWAEEERPLKVFAWQPTGTCVSAQIGATPSVTVTRVGRRAGLEVAVQDGTVESVRGTLLVELGAWLTGVWDRTIAFTHKVAADTRVRLGRRTLRLAVVSARSDRAGLEVQLEARHLDGGQTTRSNTALRSSSR